MDLTEDLTKEDEKNFAGENPSFKLENSKNNKIDLIYKINDEYVLIATCVLYTESDRDSFLEMCNKMISAFKFTDSTADTSTWKTYEGKALDGGNFSIDYPGNWALKGNRIYPTSSPDDGYIMLGASGHGGPPPTEERSFPAGKASYLWQLQGDNIYGFATFYDLGKANDVYIFETSILNPDHNINYEKIFNQMLSTFKLTN